MEPVQVPPPPDHYAGLGIQAPGADVPVTGLDRHGYIEVIADPEYDDHPQVCMEIFGDLLIIKCHKCLYCLRQSDRVYECRRMLSALINFNFKLLHYVIL